MLELLRNIAEHWDEAGGRSERELAERYPAVKPDAVSYTNKEVLLGGSDGVPLSRIKAWLYRVETALRNCLSQEGAEVPDKWMASRTPGDVDLPWPNERLRYHWSIPHLPEGEWPREEMPEEVGRLFAERFVRLRARDRED